MTQLNLEDTEPNENGVIAIVITKIVVWYLATSILSKVKTDYYWSVLPEKIQ